MTGAQIVIIVTIICYLGGMLLIGLYFNRMGSGNSSSDFYIGGRSLGPIVTAMSAEASDMSSYLLMGLPGLILMSVSLVAGIILLIVVKKRGKNP